MDGKDGKDPAISVSTLRFEEAECRDFPMRRAATESQHPPLWRNISSIRLLLSSFVACLVFSVLYCLFIYHVLIRQQPKVGLVLFDAPTSNLLISIFSQVFVLLADSLVCGLLDILRAALASREGGTSASSFFGISGATGWLSVFRLASVNGFRDVWCNFRLLVPVLGLLFVQATFDYHFAPGTVSTPVYAGLVPIDIKLLENIRTADLWIYFQSFTGILLDHPRYAVPFPMDDCAGNCTSVLLPGGLEMVRQYSPHLNLSIYHGGLFSEEAINIESSRGMVLVFERMTDYVFDWEKDCLYAGSQINDSVQVCVKQEGESVVAGMSSFPLTSYKFHSLEDFALLPSSRICEAEADRPMTFTGWTSCPEGLWATSQCKSWNTTAPLEWTTKFTGFFQPTTVTYDRTNSSIISTTPHPPFPSLSSTSQPSSSSTSLSPSPREHVPLSAADYLTLFRAVLLPNLFSDQLATSKINAITYDITWLHRTYQVSFPDQKDAPLRYLRNFLAVPIQFGVVAVEFANYSQSPEILRAFWGPQGLGLPEDMKSVATGGWSSTRLVIREWTGWVFIAGVAVLLLGVTVGGLWVARRRVGVFEGSGIPELDILRYGGLGETRDGGLLVLPGGRGGNVGSWKLAKELGGWGVLSEGDKLVAVPRREIGRRESGIDA
ncbi:hypothetical protein OQA88_12572 [Cercophora sp. LCS_1]